MVADDKILITAASDERGRLLILRLLQDGVSPTRIVGMVAEDCELLHRAGIETRSALPHDLDSLSSKFSDIERVAYLPGANMPAGHLVMAAANSANVKRVVGESELFPVDW